MNRNIFLASLLTISASLLVGCGGGGGSSNPVNSNIVSQAQDDATFVRANLGAPVCKRKFNYHKCSCNISQSIRTGLKALAAKIKLDFISDADTNNMEVTINSIMLRNTKGQKFTLNKEATVSLSGAGITNLLSETASDLGLVEGSYNYIEFAVKSASITEDGITSKIKIPFDKLKFTGNFEIKDGYETTIKIDFAHKLVNVMPYFNYDLALKVYQDAKRAYEIAGPLGKAVAKAAMDLAWAKIEYKYTFVSSVKISSELTLIPVEDVITNGDVNGTITNLINSNKLANIIVQLVGTEFRTTTDANGNFSFAEVPAGKYTLKATNDEYLETSYEVEIMAGQISKIDLQMNPAVISSTVGETGWFSEYYPVADINAAYGETSMETPIKIDFISMAFTKAEITFNAKYHENGSARFVAYFASEQQVSADTQIDNWWAGNSCHAGSSLGEYLATCYEGYTYTVDITDYLKKNPSNIYYLAARNLDIVDIKLSDIQIKIYYK